MSVISTKKESIMLNKVIRLKREISPVKSSKFMLSILVLFMAVISFGQDYSLFGKLDKKWPIFKAGEKMVFTVTLLDNGKPVSGKKMIWKRTGDDGITKTGKVISAIDNIFNPYSMCANRNARCDRDPEDIFKNTRGIYVCFYHCFHHS